LAATDPLEYWERGDATAPPAAGHPYLGFAIRAAAGVGLIAFLIRKAGGRTIVSLLMRERPAYFAAAIVLYVAGQAMSAYRWQLLAAIVGLRGKFRRFLAYYFIGMFTNLFLPGLVGGDAARAIYLGREHDRMGPAVASTVADRLVGLMALCWFAATLVWALNDGILPASVTRPVILLGLAGFAAYLAAPLIARAEHLMPHRLARPIGLVTPYLHRPAALIVPLGLSLLLQISLVIGQYILALGLGLSIPLYVMLLCLPIANTFASIPVTIGGLGLREGAYTLLFGMAGVSRVDAVALGLLWFASATLGGLVGIIPFLITPVLRPSKKDRQSP
jgi:glycosyltransferase 2 family protein